MSLEIVETKLGKLKGEVLHGEYEGITTFRSVPYAEPPVGEYRFRPPVPHAPWSGVRDVRFFAPRPYQKMGSGLFFEPWESDFYFDGLTPMSEDCLYMHITTGAQSPDEKRPVLMWFHGGGLATGFYSENEFDPRTLAKKGIIVISVGQRLNVMGYLCLPQLCEEQGGRSGNYGLLDEVMALDWVRENIGAFGGDPDNITVAGQSGGTWKSNALAISPLSQGKIRRVINQSNINWATWDYITMEEAGEQAKAYLQNIGLDPDITPEELRKLPADRFYQFDNLPLYSPVGLPQRAIWDDYSIKYQSPTKNMEVYGMDKDYLSGGNVGECNIPDRPIRPEDVFHDRESFYAYLSDKLGDLYDDELFRREWPVTDENVFFRSRELAARGFSEGVLGGGVIMNRYFGAYRKAMGSKAKTYAYMFGRFTPCRPEEKGTIRDTENLLAWHSSELWYTFGSLRKGMPPARPWEETDFRLADQMSSYWANFIAKGDPNGEGLPYWPLCDESYSWQYLGDTIEAHEGVDELDKLMIEYLKRSGRYPVID